MSAKQNADTIRMMQSLIDGLNPHSTPDEFRYVILKMAQNVGMAEKEKRENGEIRFTMNRYFTFFDPRELMKAQV